LRLGRGSAESGEEKRACAEPVPGLASQMEDVACAVGRAGESCADQEKRDGGNSDDGDVAEQGLSGGTGSAETGVDERYAGDGERGEEQQNEGEGEYGVGHNGRDGGSDGKCGRIHQRASPRGSM